MTLNWPDIVDDNLQAAVAAKLVDIELVQCTVSGGIVFDAFYIFCFADPFGTVPVSYTHLSRITLQEC